MTEWDFVKLLENYGMDVSKYQTPGELELDYVRVSSYWIYLIIEKKTIPSHFILVEKTHFSLAENFITDLRVKLVKFLFWVKIALTVTMTTDYQRYEMDDEKGVTDAITYLAKRFKDISNSIRIKIVNEDF